MGYHLYMLCHPADLPAQDYGEYKSDVFVKHDLGKLGIYTFRRLLQAFTLAQYPIVDGQTDHVIFIRCFADEWNINMLRCVTPDRILVVDESMGRWLGKGMPNGARKLPQMKEKGILLLTVKLSV